MRKFFCHYSIFLLSFFCISSPALAKDGVKDPRLPLLFVSAEEFISNVRTFDGRGVTCPEVGVKAGVHLAPGWVLELRYFRGASQLVNGYQIAIGDFEGRVIHELAKRRAAWLSWKVWSSKNTLNNARTNQRDEGLGIGYSQWPAKQGFSYWYSFGWYPSLTGKFIKNDAITVDGGTAFGIGNGLTFVLGYRYQAIRNNGSHERSQEQGPMFGFRVRF